MTLSFGRAHLLSTTAVTALLAGALAGPAPARAQDELIEATVLDVTGDSVQLNRGRRDGVREGQVFDVFLESEVYFLPLTRGEKPLVKSQERAGQLVIYDTEPTTSRARIVFRDSDSNGRAHRILKDLRAIQNPTATPPNQPPRFTSEPSPTAVPWRSAVPLKFRVTNEEGEAVIYEWNTSSASARAPSSGRLLYQRTTTPENVWLAPPQSGRYRVNVKATDMAGKTSRETIEVVSTGIGNYRPGNYRSRGFLTASSRYETVIDLAFDSRNRCFVLERAAGGMFSSGELRVRIEEPGAQERTLEVGDRELTRLVVAGGGKLPEALFALDADARTALRFPIGSDLGQLLKRKPTVIGNPEGSSGNGVLREPIDLAVSPEGDRVYVLDAGQRCVQVFGSDGEFLLSFGQPGTKELRLQQPRAIATGPQRRVYVLDNARNSVIAYSDFRAEREFRAGPAGSELNGLAVDPLSGDVFVLDKSQGAVRRFTAQGSSRTPEFRGQRGSLQQLDEPQRLRMDRTRVLWVVDREGSSVARIDGAAGELLGRTGGFEFSGALRLAATPEGGVVALDGDYWVTVFDPDGWATARFGGRGSKPGQFSEAVDLTVGRTGDIYVLDAERQHLLAFTRGGRFRGKLGSAGTGDRQLLRPVDVTASADRSLLAVVQQREKNNFNLIDPGRGSTVGIFGRAFTDDLTPRFGCVTGVSAQGPSKGVYWTVDEDQDYLRRTADGRAPQQVRTEFDEITDIEPLVSRHVFVCDYDDERVVILDDSGRSAGVLDSSKVGEGCWDIALDDYGRLFVYDRSTQRILVLEDR